MAMISFTATSGKLSDKGKYPNVFRTTTPDPKKLDITMKWLKEEFGIKVR